MVYKHTKLLSLFLGIFIFTHNAWSAEQNNDLQNRQKEISQLYLQKFPTKIVTAEDSLAMMEEEQKKVVAYVFKIQQMESPYIDIDKIAHGIVTNQVLKEANSIIPVKTAQKLALFETNEKDCSLLNKLSESFVSNLAKNALLYELTNPTTNVELLFEKQEFIKIISAKKHLQNILKTTEQLELSILNLLNYEPMLPKYVEDGTYFGGPIARLVNLDWLFKPLNKYPMMLELKAPGLNTFIDVGLTTLSATALITVGPELVNKYLTGGMSPQELVALQAMLKASYITRTKECSLALAAAVPAIIKQAPGVIKQSSKASFEQYKEIFKKAPMRTALVTTLGSVFYGGIFGGLVVWPSIAQTYNTENWFAHLQKYFIDFASYLDQTRAITTFFKQQNLNFPLAFPELQSLIDLDNKAKHSADFNQLVDLLKTGTFKGEASKLSYLGRVKCAYKLFMNVRQEFEPILYAMAKLQMYNSIAELMASSANKENSFCFAEFIDYGPYVQATDFWNPMVGQENAVSNSLLMTPDQKDIVLHGPNTGGKTTTIKGLIYNILLAQALGIAAARQLILSPFAQINCFMDIQDDVSAGSSLFDAEVRFATELHNNIQSLLPGEYAFTIADEILRSTSPSKGQACAYQFTKKLAKNRNSMSITVTHYPKLVELATETPNNGFRTFHVEIKRENGKVIRTFKLKEGSTIENIAGDILQEHGIFDAADLLEVERLEEAFAV